MCFAGLLVNFTPNVVSRCAVFTHDGEVVVFGRGLAGSRTGSGGRVIPSVVGLPAITVRLAAVRVFATR